MPCIQKAFEIAQSGVPGPVFVELPVDLTWPAKEILKTMEGMMPRCVIQCRYSRSRDDQISTRMLLCIGEAKGWRWGRPPSDVSTTASSDMLTTLLSQAWDFAQQHCTMVPVPKPCLTLHRASPAPPVTTAFSKGASVSPERGSRPEREACSGQELEARVGRGVASHALQRGARVRW